MNDKKKAWFPVDGPEARIVITGFFLLFCVLGGYFAVRPIRETIGTVLPVSRSCVCVMRSWPTRRCGVIDSAFSNANRE